MQDNRTDFKGNEMTFDWNARVRVKMRNGWIVDDTDQIYDVGEAITAVPWITARQYPPPHQYVIFGRCPPLAWDVLACAVAKHPESYLAYFRGYQKPMRYWEFEGYRYWRTASRNPSGKITHMLNRCGFDDVEPPRRVDQGAKPRLDWDGPPWLPERSPWPDWFVKGPDGRYRYCPELDPARQKKPQP